MTSSEIEFLAIGLVAGAAIGAALAQVVRTRPAPRREVRLTITPNAIPARRLQAQAVAHAAPPGALGSGMAGAGAPASTRPAPVPAAAASRLDGRLDGPEALAARTRVPSGTVSLPSTAIAVPVGDPVRTPAVSAARNARPPVVPPRPPQDPGRASAVGASAVALAVGSATAIAVMEPPEPVRAAVAAPPVPLPPPMLSRPGARPGRGAAERAAGHAPTIRPEAFTTLVRPRPPVETPRPSLAPGAVPVAVRPLALIGGIAPVVRPALATPSGPTLTRPRASSGPAGLPGRPADPGAMGASGAPGPAADPCGDQRRAVEERCALSEVASEQAGRAADALREAQRAYDVLREAVDHAIALADPRHVAAAKEQLHASFRAAGDRAGTAEATEAAARAWLNEINALNTAVREAQRTVETGTAELRSRIGALERLSAEAGAARIAFENAEAGCRGAREELAGCEETDARTRAAVPPAADDPHPFARVWPEDSPNMPDRPSPADVLAGLPLVVRVLRGDRDARERLVAILAAGDADAVREWGLRVSRLADAIIGRAIEDGYLDLPEDDPFWRLFSHHECRDIVGALSALGFRYDGMGGFADGRAPSARDLSLAVGYAGLDRMRIRTWPRDSEISRLYERAVVSADQWLADQAGDLSLGRMVDALGNRAADLADLWNAWGRVRPALLAT